MVPMPRRMEALALARTNNIDTQRLFQNNSPDDCEGTGKQLVLFEHWQWRASA